MPIMNGWEFLDYFVNINGYKETIIFIVSSTVNSSEIDKAEKHPKVSGFIGKPIKPEDFLEISKKI